MTEPEDPPPHRDMDPVQWASQFHILYAKPCPNGYEPALDPQSHDWAGQFPIELQDHENQYDVWEEVVYAQDNADGRMPRRWLDFKREWGPGLDTCYPTIPEALEAWITCFYRWWDAKTEDPDD